MQPILFTLWGQPLYAYIVGTGLAYALGAVLGVVMGLLDKRSLSDLVEAAIVVVLSAVLGSKVFHVLFEARGHVLSTGAKANGVLDLLADDPWHAFRLFESGYVFYGGAVGGILLGWWFVKGRFSNPLRVADYTVPGFALGIGVGRVGCFLAGCCHGRSTTVPWAVHFPLAHPTHGEWVHPVQLYDAAFGFLAFALSLLMYRRTRFGGQLFLAFCASYALWRFTTEMFRDDAERGLWLSGLISTSQLTALCTLPLIAIVWRRSARASDPTLHSAPSTLVT